MTTTNDAPAPAPSESGVRVKPLEWQPTSSVFCWHAASAVGRYFIEERHSDFRWNVEGWPGEWAVNTLDEAKAAAQADYESRILSALASDTSPRGEAVAWRVRERPGFPWRLIDGDPERMPGARGLEREPLYAHPAPATVEMREAAIELLSHLKLYVMEKLEGIDADMLHDRMYDLTAALAPATEGRKG